MGLGGEARQSRRAPLAPKGFGLPLQVTISCPLRYADGLATKGFHMMWMYGAGRVPRSRAGRVPRSSRRVSTRDRDMIGQPVRCQGCSRMRFGAKVVGRGTRPAPPCSRLPPPPRHTHGSTAMILQQHVCRRTRDKTTEHSHACDMQHVCT